MGAKPIDGTVEMSGHKIEWKDDATVPHYKCERCGFPFLSLDDVREQPPC